MASHHDQGIPLVHGELPLYGIHCADRGNRLGIAHWHRLRRGPIVSLDRPILTARTAAVSAGDSITLKEALTAATATARPCG